MRLGRNSRRCFGLFCAIAVPIFGASCLPTPRSKNDVRPASGTTDGSVKRAQYETEGDTSVEPKRLLGRTSGRIIAPKRCPLQYAILTRPSGEKALNEAVWSIVDGQAVPAESKAALEANGILIGVVTGSLPVEVEKVLKAPPPNRVDPVQVDLPDGDQTLVKIAPPAETVTLLINQKGKAVGKDYADAGGVLRLTLNLEESGATRVRIVPEIHHGPTRQTYAASNPSDQFSPKDFMVKNGQQEDSLRDLAATITLAPGQIAVIGGRAEDSGNLGAFLFSEKAPNSDRAMQKLLLIWALSPR